MSAADAAGAPEIVSKKQFATLTRVSPGRVSQWISEKKLNGDALVGEGRSAQIRVAVALAQLRLRLDIDQRLSGNGLNTRLDSPPGSGGSEVVGGARLFTDLGGEGARGQGGPASAPLSDELEEQIKRERLATLQRQNRKLAEDEALRTGQLTLTVDVESQFGRMAADLIQRFDAVIADLAEDLAPTTGMPKRALMQRMGGVYRNWRARTAEELRIRADCLAQFIEVEITEPGSVNREGRAAHSEGAIDGQG